jgi:translation initiation factor 3 subunit E
MWGKTACEILLQKWDEAREDFNKLKMFIENHVGNFCVEVLFLQQFSTELELLQQRAWLIHWSLWVSILPSTGDYNTRDDFITLCFENNGFVYLCFLQIFFKLSFFSYMNAMEVVCPHILRYLTVAVVTSRKRKNYLKELVKIIKIVR